MSHRRKQSTRRFDHREMFTLAEVMIASPTNPMPAWDAEKRCRDTVHHLEQLAMAPEPTALDWRTVAMTGNVLEVLLEKGAIDDPEGVLASGFDAMRAGARRFGAGGKIRFTGDELTDIRALTGNWRLVLEQCPHRTLLQAFREVYRRIQDRDAGALRDGHLAAQLDGWKS